MTADHNVACMHCFSANKKSPKISRQNPPIRIHADVNGAAAQKLSFSPKSKGLGKNPDEWRRCWLDVGQL